MINGKAGWKRTGILLAAGLILTGCQLGKYQKVELETEASEEALQAAGGDLASAAVKQVESSAMTAERTTETAPAMAERDETVYATSKVNIRTAPNTDSEVIAVLVPGEAVKRVGYSESWSQVIYKEKTYYIASAYLSTEKPAQTQTAAETDNTSPAANEAVALNPEWKYAGFSKINSETAVLYRSEAASHKNKVVCINAGHGTQGGSSVKTQCHPDGTPKVTGGTTAAGATTAVAVSGGMQFADGTQEAKVTLSMALVLKDKLLARGYDVLMIRESDDVQLDNIARTVIANNKADCHIALHWDSTGSDKGAFYMSVPDVSSYRNMEPVASNWQKHHALGDSLISGLKAAGVKIFSGGTMAMDLTQTSYSTIPSVDIELGDKASDHSAATLDKLGNGLADGVDRFFAER